MITANSPFSIAYIKREYPKSYYRNRYKIPWGLANEAKCYILWFLGRIKNIILFNKIDGYFDASLLTIDGLREMTLAELRKCTNLSKLDAIVVHYRCCATTLHGDDSVLVEIAKSFDGVKALYINDDKAETMKPDEILDLYDVIFKREPFKDLSKYPISEHNMRKIRPTMLSCPRFHKSRLKGSSTSSEATKWTDQNNSNKSYDVFFIGKITPARLCAWQSVVDSGVVVCGGLVGRHGHEKVPELLLADPMKQKEFLQAIRLSKINLAISGHGQFTHRHLEILAAGGFLLTDKSLSDLWLPINLKEGVHYAEFYDTADLLQKTDYYLKNELEREAIAQAGKEVFSEQYSVGMHGKYLRDCIQGVEKNNTV